MSNCLVRELHNKFGTWLGANYNSETSVTIQVVIEIHCFIDQRSEMEELVAEKQEVVSQLQENYQKLEDSVIAAKKLTSRRHIQLTKLHKCYLHMRDCDERFKQAEQELQWLVDSTATELGNGGGGVGDDIITNGRA
ncbi:uncharacterized protein LOC121808831 [Salvia splendens]|uniref:uncharacterized protein LOC121808831 n=1 Tax=Salvia splendens TaxID=180675 RepID=UPI001C262CAE|nr:uncharacterized protein LOC121808831 [Salvia splendens]